MKHTVTVKAIRAADGPQGIHVPIIDPLEACLRIGDQVEVVSGDNRDTYVLLKYPDTNGVHYSCFACELIGNSGDRCPMTDGGLALCSFAASDVLDKYPVYFVNVDKIMEEL